MRSIITTFMKTNQTNAMKTFTNNNNEQITEDLNKQYDAIIEQLQEAKEKGLPIDEGLFGSIFGGIAGATAGPTIMKAVCNVLGVDERGTFGNLLTSRLVLAALGAKLGWKM